MNPHACRDVSFAAPAGVMQERAHLVANERSIEGDLLGWDELARLSENLPIEGNLQGRKASRTTKAFALGTVVALVATAALQSLVLLIVGIVAALYSGHRYFSETRKPPADGEKEVEVEWEKVSLSPRQESDGGRVTIAEAFRNGGSDPIAYWAEHNLGTKHVPEDPDMSRSSDQGLIDEVDDEEGGQDFWMMYSLLTAREENTSDPEPTGYDNSNPWLAIASLPESNGPRW